MKTTSFKTISSRIAHSSRVAHLSLRSSYFIARSAFFLVALAMLPGCKDNAADPALSISTRSIVAPPDAIDYTVNVSSDAAWTAAVSYKPSWLSISPESGEGDGTITVSVKGNEAYTERIASVKVSAGAASKALTVTQEALPIPVLPDHAASNKVWKYGDQVWSDAIHVPACKEATFGNSLTEPHCRSYTASGNTWYYYNWAYVNQNAETLCQNPWRVPDKEDFEALVAAVNTKAALLYAAWGYGGNADSVNGNISDAGSLIGYWSSTPNVNDNTQAYALVAHVSWGEEVGVAGWGSRAQHGFQVRCVK
jgi:hypothetical protein